MMIQSISKINNPPNSPYIQLNKVLESEAFYSGYLCDVKQIKDSMLVAKVIYKEKFGSGQSYKKEYSFVYHEIKTLYSIKHANIIELLGHMETEKHIVLVFPKFGQNLKKFIKANIDKAKKETKTFTVDDFVFIFRQIVSAVSQLHCMGCIHRDISDDNILIDENMNIKLIDFGNAGVMRTSYIQLGTRQFLAPQIIENKKYTYKVDIWALGILAFYLLYGVYMFKPKGKYSEEELAAQYLKKINEQNKNLPDEKLLVVDKPNAQMLAILKQMLNRQSSCRPQLGYILAKGVLGVQDRSQLGQYELQRYIRKTERKMQVNENMKEMSIKELEQSLYNLINVHEEQLGRQRNLILQLLQKYKNA